VQALGTDLVVIHAAPAPAVAGRSRQQSTVTTLRPQDADLLARESDLARATAAAVVRPIVARWDGRNAPTTLLGTTPEGLRIQRISVHSANGRLYDDTEELQRRRVALVGATVARNLFGGTDPVGHSILLGRTPVEVVGVMQRRGTDAGGTDLDNTVVVPLGTAMRRVLNVPFVDAVFAQARTTAGLDALEREARAILGERHRSRSGVPAEFVVRNQAVLLRTERGATESLRRLTWVTGVLSLIVGGVGILALMLLSVRERVREIALRRAVGARVRDIQLQFVLESAMLTAAGGIAGVLVGAILAAVAALIGPWELVVPWRALAAAMLGAIGAGLAAGVIPAVLAARLDPAVGLRAR
jgi:putative ABC transport system permease protein